MQNIRIKIAARYLASLRTHLGKNSPGNGEKAQSLGRAALSAGLVTLDIVSMHEQAVAALSKSFDFTSIDNGSIKKAGYFFTQTLLPLEAALRAAKEANQQLLQRNETLRLHTAALAKGNRKLEREIIRRKAGEAMIRTSKKEYQKLFLQSQIMQKKLTQLTRQILSIQEDERREISRELHDEVVQTLVGINVELSALGKGTSIGLRSLKAKIARTQKLVENSVKAVHRFARELRPAVLDDLGLIPALHAYNKSLAARKNIKIHLTAFAGVEALDIAKRTVLYRVAQEALTNVVRHAHATEIMMKISELPGAIRMEISDDGKSFKVEKTLLSKNNRLGLIGMRERVEMVGGNLTIESEAGKGTTVRADIPFNEEN